MNHVRTGLLLAALTGLFLAIGYLIGGEGGMLLAFGVAVAMNFSTMPPNAPPSGFVRVARLRISSAYNERA